METPNTARSLASALALAVALAAMAATANAGVLYKSVNENGTIMFSDLPPPEGARVIEQRVIPSASNAPAPLPVAVDLAQLIDSDAALARANARVDQAERELAQARREATPAFMPASLKLGPPRTSLASDERIEFYKRNVSLARRELVALLGERQLASR